MNMCIPNTTLFSFHILLVVVNIYWSSPSPVDAYNGSGWWKNSFIYTVYPRSFQDSNGDGVGDLRGIIMRLPYLDSLGVDVICLNTIYASPMADFGYDVSDFYAIDPIFGTFQDFQTLLELIHQRGLKLIIDMIPNHTSDQHEWFQKSAQGGATEDNIYSEYYIWSDGKLNANGSRVAPNNWLSNSGGSAWSWNHDRQQFFYHQYDKHQPDLNHRNPKVQQEILNVFHFWLDKGVDGFRIDAFDSLIEEKDVTKNEPQSEEKGLVQFDYKYYSHIYTSKRPELHTVIRLWRQKMDEYGKDIGKHIMLMLQTRNQDHVGKEFWEQYHRAGADSVLNTKLLYGLHRHCGAHVVKTLIDQVTELVPNNSNPTWMLAASSYNRIGSKMGEDSVDMMNMLQMFLPGIVITYYGEELGMKDIEVSYEDTQDPRGINYGLKLYMKYSRDMFRSPMHWTNQTNADFTTTGKPWLPLHSDYQERNVQVQSEQKGSSLCFFKELVTLRKRVACQFGRFRYALVTETLLSFIRYNTTIHDKELLLIFNFGNETARYNLDGEFSHLYQTKGTVTLATPASNLKPGGSVNLADVTLQPGESLILTVIRNKRKNRDI